MVCASDGLTSGQSLPSRGRSVAFQSLADDLHAREVPAPRCAVSGNGLDRRVWGEVMGDRMGSDGSGKIR